MRTILSGTQWPQSMSSARPEFRHRGARRKGWNQIGRDEATRVAQYSFLELLPDYGGRYIRLTAERETHIRPQSRWRS